MAFHPTNSQLHDATNCHQPTVVGSEQLEAWRPSFLMVVCTFVLKLLQIGSTVSLLWQLEVA